MLIVKSNQNEIMFYIIIERPLRIMYMNAPSFGNVFGGWNGMNEDDICARMTNTSSSMWAGRARNLECFDIIQKRFDSLYSTFCIVIYFIILFSAIREIIHILRLKIYMYYLHGDMQRLTSSEHKYLR